MSLFYRNVGDLPSALEHALHALEFMPSDALPELWAEHLLGAALAFDESGNAEEAARRYQEVVDVGIRIGHPRLSINALNNMAYVHCEKVIRSGRYPSSPGCRRWQTSTAPC